MQRENTPTVHMVSTDSESLFLDALNGHELPPSHGSLPDDDDDDDVEISGSDRGDDSIVRANSSFRNLTQDSWITVSTERDANENDPTDFFPQVEEEEVVRDPRYSNVTSEMRSVSLLKDRSVMDCVVSLLRGMRVRKRRALLNLQDWVWIWLGEDLLTLFWKSKKRHSDQGRVNLRKVRRLIIINRDRSITFEMVDGHKYVFVLRSKREASTILTGLSCLVPRKATVLVGNQVLEKRVRYNPFRDSWKGKPVATRRTINDYIILGGIGRGAFGQVHLALSRQDKRFHAVKIISSRRAGRPSPLNSPEEQAILRKLDHPNIVKHHDILEDKENGYAVFVMEYMARGVVMNSAKLSGVRPLPEDGVRDIMRYVLAGLDYLHFHHIAHRDIKPDNLLVSGDGTVKLSDFGEARMYDVRNTDLRSGSAPGTPAFIAPELCMSDKSPQPMDTAYAADIWSLGATLFYMVYGRVPFLANGVFEIFETICTEKLRFPEAPKTSRELKDLIKKMMTKEPRNRATLQEVASHPWFRGKVLQPGKLKPIRITRMDIENAIGVASWSRVNSGTSSSFDDD